MERRERILLADNKFVMLVGNIALDLVFVDQIRHEALGLVCVSVRQSRELERNGQRRNVYQMRAEQMVHFLEQVAECNHPQFFQHDVDSVFDEERLRPLDGFAEAVGIALSDGLSGRPEFHEVVLLEEISFRQVAKQHFHWNQVNENAALVLLAVDVAVTE